MGNPTPDEPISIGSKAEQKVLCAECRQETPAGQYYTYRDKKGQDLFLCGACRQKAEAALQGETENPNLMGAVLLGLLGGLLAGVVWYLIVAITRYEIGYVALGVGYLIGWSVYFGSGKKRGFHLQMISVGITLATLMIAAYFTVLHFLREYLLQEKVEGYQGQFFFISPLDPAYLKSLVSPMGLLIWAIALYIAFSVSKPRAL